MKLKTVMAAILIAAISLAISGNLSAEEKKVEINTAYSMKQVLDSQVGQRLSLKTDSGEALEGTITSVGDHLVHISKLSGRDFYDAVVVIDRITSVVFRARGN